MKRLSGALVALLLAALVPAAHAQAKDTKPAGVDTLAMLEKAVAKDSTKFDNLYKLGVLYLDKEDMAKAAQVLAKADQVKPKQLKVLVNLGVALDALGKSNDAQERYQAALVASPGDSVAMCRLASSFYAQGKYDDAMKALRQVIRDKPTSHCAYFTMGVAFADAGLYRDAIRMWKKVIELQPSSPEAVSAKESIEVLEKFLAGS